MATSGPEIGGRPAYARLTLVRGDEWSRPITLRSGGATGDPIILTGSTFTVDVRKHAGGPILFNPELAVQSAAGGVIVLTITEAMSLSLTAGTSEGDVAGQYCMTLRMVDAAGQRRTLLVVQIVLLAGG